MHRLALESGRPEDVDHLLDTLPSHHVTRWLGYFTAVHDAGRLAADVDPVEPSAAPPPDGWRRFVPLTEDEMRAKFQAYNARHGAR